MTHVAHALDRAMADVLADNETPDNMADTADLNNGTVEEEYMYESPANEMNSEETEIGCNFDQILISNEMAKTYRSKIFSVFLSGGWRNLQLESKSHFSATEK